MSLTPEQVLLRMSGVGSSEVPAICDIYPRTWKARSTPDSVFAEKLGGPGFEGNARTRVGERLEPFVALWWSEDNKRPTRRFGETVRHPKYPFALATPDYVTDDPAEEIVECKVVSYFVGKHWNGEPAPWSYLQLIWQLGVTGKPRGHLAAHVQGGDELVRSYPVEFDPDLFANALSVVSRFWDRVLAARAERGMEVSP